MSTNDAFLSGLFMGLLFAVGLTPLLFFVVWPTLGKLCRGWALHIQTADDFERAVKREVDKRWRDLETERRLKIINLEVEERMIRERTERGAATQKR